VIIQIVVFGVVTPCSLVSGYKRYVQHLIPKRRYPPTGLHGVTTPEDHNLNNHCHRMWKLIPVIFMGRQYYPRFISRKPTISRVWYNPTDSPPYTPQLWGWRQHMATSYTGLHGVMTKKITIWTLFCLTRIYFSLLFSRFIKEFYCDWDNVLLLLLLLLMLLLLLLL
jgi:hypothetical protein